MKTLDIEQNTPEWERARIGLPTASRFGDIVTPKTLRLSASAGKYMGEILAEWLFDRPMDFNGSSQWMERGTEQEPKARAFYEFDRDVTVETVGFVLRDDEKVGGSPDGLVGDAGGLEIKVPALHTHVRYLVDPVELLDSYRAQVQGYLYLTGREWWDLLSYNSDLPPVVVRVERDAEHIAALAEALDQFVADLDDAKDRLREYRQEYVPPTVEAAVAAGLAP